MTTIEAPQRDARLVRPGDRGWDAARATFNVLIDQRPDAIAVPTDAHGVAAAVAWARERGLRVVPQSTGHNAGPLGSLEGALLLRTSALREVAIDAAARRVRVGTGVTWGEVTPALSELGLAGLHGSSPLVGIAGYSLGGGIGWLARKHGMQTNAVTAIELATADGRLVRTDAEHHPELFWALRGGGGSFGVVTAIEFSVLPLRELYAGALFFPLERTAEVLGTWTELLPQLPEEMTTWANVLHFPPDPGLPEPIRGRSFAVTMAAFLGDEAEGRALLTPLRALGAEIDTLATQPPVGLGELAMDPPEPLPLRLEHALVDELPPRAIEETARIAGAGSALAMVQIRHVGGALARKAPGAGARATLPGELCVLGLGVPGGTGTDAAVRGELAALSAVLAPHRAGDYPNFVEGPADASAFFDRETWARLRAVKDGWDPEDVFNGNHHVPATVAREAAA
jgi:FAD/FMN-containing dehydrogenase